MSGNCNPRKPSALVVFLENVGHIHGIPLPQWMMNVIDYATEEYAKFLLRLLGAYRLYEAVIILEDDAATGPRLASTLIETSQTHQIDLLLLVHGQEGALIGYKARESVGRETFCCLRSIYHANHSALDLRMVFGLNCYGITLAPLWLDLGAQITNGAVGVNWLPEPSLSVFLRYWLAGYTFTQAIDHSHQQALRWGRRIWRPNHNGHDHPRIASSRQVIYGAKDITICS